MNLLQEPPAGFAGIAKAFAMARHLPTTHQLGVQIGLLRDGVLFARGQLDGYRQVSFFADHMRQVGWRELLLGGDEEMHGCDMVFADPASGHPPPPEADPSFIRRPAVELWPARDQHALDR